MPDDDELQWGASTDRTIDGVRIHVESAGAGSPVALLHGFASGTFGWAGLAPLLVEAGHQAIAWDRPPFGRSDRPAPDPGPNDTYRRDAEVSRTRAILDEVERPTVIGHSAGALAAADAVLAGALTPRALVLIAPVFEGGPPAAVRSLARARGVGAVGRFALRRTLPHAETLLRRASRHPTPLQHATARATARSLALPGTAEALWHLTSTWADPKIDGEGIRALGIPTLVIAGAHDRVARPESVRSLADTIGADLRVIDAAGHAPQEQCPELVLEAIAGMLR